MVRGVPFDPRDQRLLHWLARLSPREELVVRMALRARHQIGDRVWNDRIDVLLKVAKIDTAAKMAKLLRDVHRTADEIDG